jgi:hypothetical protein
VACEPVGGTLTQAFFKGEKELREATRKIVFVFSNEENCFIFSTRKIVFVFLTQKW